MQPVSDTHGERFKWGLDRFIAEAQTLARFKHPGGSSTATLSPRTFSSARTSPVLIDFGSARQALGAELTTLVSPGYAPFEQYSSKGEQGPWTDIYGLGATLYRAVTGQRPRDAVDRSRAILEAARDTLGDIGEIGQGRYSARFLKGDRSRAAVPPEGPGADGRRVAPRIRRPAGHSAQRQPPGQRHDGRNDRRR